LNIGKGVSLRIESIALHLTFIPPPLRFPANQSTKGKLWRTFNGRLQRIGAAIYCAARAKLPLAAAC
jgi:hypothetical protein